MSGPYTEGWPKTVYWSRPGDSGRYGPDKVVPLSDAERMRERIKESEATTERVCQRLWKVHNDRERIREALVIALDHLSDQCGCFAPGHQCGNCAAREKARAALNPEPGK